MKAEGYFIPLSSSGKTALREFADSRYFSPFVFAANKAFFRFARKHYRWSHREDMEDAWQSAVIDVFVEKPHNFKVPEGGGDSPNVFERTLRRYLCTAAANKLATRLRSVGKGMQRAQSFDEMLEECPDLDRFLYETGRIAPAADEEVEKRMMGRVLDACLAKLSPRTRETFKLALLGHSDVEIQTMTQSHSASTIRRRVSESKKLVIACVKRQWGGGHE